MNDRLVELASAYVDGEASPEEIAWVEANDEARALVAEFRRLAESNRSLPTPPPTLSTRHLTQALTLFDTLGSAEGGDKPMTPTATVTPLRPRRGARLTQMAAGLLLIGAIGLAATQLRPGGNSDDSAEMAEVAPAAETAAEAFAVEAGDGAMVAGGDDEAAPFSATADALRDASAPEAPVFSQADPADAIVAGLGLDLEAPDLAGDAITDSATFCNEGDFPAAGTPEQVRFLTYEDQVAQLLYYHEPVRRLIIVNDSCVVLRDEVLDP